MRLYLVLHLGSDHLVILFDEVRAEAGIGRRAPRRRRIDQVIRFRQLLVIVEEVFQVQKLGVLRLLDYARQAVLRRDWDPEVELRRGGQRPGAIVHLIHLQVAYVPLQRLIRLQADVAELVSHAQSIYTR